MSSPAYKQLQIEHLKYYDLELTIQLIKATMTQLKLIERAYTISVLSDQTIHIRLYGICDCHNRKNKILCEYVIFPFCYVPHIVYNTTRLNKELKERMKEYLCCSCECYYKDNKLLNACCSLQ